MKYNICFFLLSFCITPCFAQKFNFNQGGTRAKNYYEEIPYDTLNGKMFVYVGIAGKKHKFLFDTGAPVGINKELSVQIGSAVADRVPLIDADGNKDSASVLYLDSLQLGSLVFNHIPALDGLPDFYKCWGVEGTIGSNLLRNSIVSINPSKLVIILTDNTSKLSLDSGKAIPLITDPGPQSDPKVRIQFPGGSEALMGFDTGEAGFMRISQDFMDQLKRTGIFKVMYKGYGAHTFSMAGEEQQANKYMLKFPSVYLANALFKNVMVETNKNAVIAIGTTVLHYGSVTLDFIHGRFYFEAFQTNNDLYEKQWPFRPSLKGNTLVIGEVWERHGAGELKAGEQILAIDDLNFDHIDLCDMLNSTPISRGKESLVLTLKDDKGNIKKVSVKKE